MKIKQQNKIFFLLAVPIILMLGMMAIYFYLGDKKMARSYETIAELSSYEVQQSVLSFLDAKKTATENFAAPFFYRRTVKDSITGDSISVFAAKYEEYRGIRSDIYESLAGFLLANSGVCSVGMAFSNEIIDPAFPVRGFAPLVERIDKDNFVFRDLAAERDVYSSTLYQEGISTLTPFFSHPVQLKSYSKQMVVTFVLPIFNYHNHNEVIAQIWVDVELDALCDILAEHKINEESTSFIISDNHKIVATDTYEHLCENDWDFLHIDTLKIREFDAAIDKLFEAENLVHQELSLISGKKYYVFSYPLQPFNMSLVITLPKRVIYKDLAFFRRAVVLTSLVGALFMLLCSFFVFRTYSRNYRREERVRNELEIASGIQKSFLPAEGLQLDTIELYATTKAAEEIGGDLFDYVAKDGKLYFCLGDVSGKGIPASMMMSMVSSLFRAVVSTTEKAAEIAYVINNALAERNAEYMFCTMFIGVVDTNSGALDYCNAGHNPPVAFNAEGCRYFSVKANCPLGLVKDKVFEGEQDVIEDGQMLFLYSDGVTEARSSNSKLFGEEKLLKVLQKAGRSTGAKSIVQAVASAVSKFAAGVRQSDDITMLCIRRK